MKKPSFRALRAFRPNHLTVGIIFGLAAVTALLFYKLGTLTSGMSGAEVDVIHTPVGWHGMYHHAVYLPLQLMRSVVLYAFDAPGAFLIRTPNAIFGLLSICAFAWLIKLWHGNRTAVFATALFATSAWLLHVSRFASFDVLYLWGTTTLLLTYALLQRYGNKAFVWYGSLVVWGLIFYIPGMAWLVVITAVASRKNLHEAWKHFSRWWQRAAYWLLGLIWLPLLAVNVARSGQLKVWLGLPESWPAPLDFLHDFAAVFYHLFVRGPEYPLLWLGRAPLLDIFTLAACVIGIYFYASHRYAARSRVLGAYLLVGAILVALGGAVSFSILVPILYVAAATGIAYLIREWLQVFPLNPFARGLGLLLITLAVAVSCLYNLRAYFIAWPHNTTTHSLFRHYP